MSPAAPPAGRAGDFLAPEIFKLIAVVRREAARVTSPERAAVEAQALPRSPGDEDPEAIHDFRVALRRLRTLLRPARRVFGERRLRALSAELGCFAREVGALRDEEVLRETLAALELPSPARAGLDAWLLQRARQERTRRRRASALVAGTAGGPAVGDTLARLEHRLGHRRRGELAAAALAEGALARAAAGVAGLLDYRPTDAARMHALRIRYKRLRYTAELFAPLLGERAAAHAKAAARMQKRLGELHDLDEALARIDRARSLPGPTRDAVSRALRRARAHLRSAVREDLAAERARLAHRSGP
jgi:CHAD domain-containing protein